MQIKYLSRRTLTVWLMSLLLAGLTLSACGAADEADEQKPVGSNQAVANDQLEATEAPEPTEEVAPTVVAQADNENLLAPSQALPGTNPAASCQSVDVPDNPLVAAVSNSDWILGSTAAPITVIEYGDFQ